MEDKLLTIEEVAKTIGTSIFKVQFNCNRIPQSGGEKGDNHGKEKQMA